MSVIAYMGRYRNIISQSELIRLEPTDMDAHVWWCGEGEVDPRPYPIGRMGSMIFYHSFECTIFSTSHFDLYNTLHFC